MATAASTLIIGGAGFVGARLVAQRLQRGNEVHIAVRPTTRLDRLMPYRDRVTIHMLTLDDRRALDAILDEIRPETVFHLATDDRRAAQPDLADATLSLSGDLSGLLNVVAACAAAAVPPRVMVRAGSLAEYGPIAAPYDEEQREMPQSAYAAALVAGTCYARMLAPRLPFPLVTARLALLYGPAQSERFLLPKLITHCLAGRRMALLRPSDRRDLMHVDDAVAGLERLADHPVVPIVNLATGEAPTMLDLAALVCRATGADPGLFDLGPQDPPGGTPDLRGSNTLARRVLGWAPRTALDAGIARTVATYRRDDLDQGLAA